MCVNYPKFLNSHKLSSPLVLLGLKSFHRFVILSGKVGFELVTCLVFYLVIKIWRNLWKIPYQTWQKTAKTLKKNKKCYNKKRQILFHRFLGESIFSNPPPSLKREMKIPEKFGRRENQLFKKWSGQNGTA